MSQASATSESRDHSPSSAGLLLSIHLTSNRPENFRLFLDRLEETTTDPSSIEIVVKIDDDDTEMNQLLPVEAARRPFRIVYITGPRNAGFYDLWRCFDDLLDACDPNAYFVINLNDEMRFAKSGWDIALRRYVGLYPDHIYRLRTSNHRLRSYYDFWEPGWSNDTSSFMTKRWLDVGGGWCPCNGPDTFQQSVAFYFGWLYRFDISRPYRELPVYDIEFQGAGDNIGLTGSELRRRMRGALKPWFILMSYRMQQEAARRALKLHAQIWKEAYGDRSFVIRDNRLWRRIDVLDPLTRNTVFSRSYRLSWLRIALVNAFRKFDFGYYSGLGAPFRHRYFHNFVEYICLRHEWADQLREGWHAQLDRHPALRLIVSPIARFFQWQLYRPHFIARGLKDPERALRRIRMLFTHGTSAGVAARCDARGAEAQTHSVERKAPLASAGPACTRSPRG